MKKNQQGFSHIEIVLVVLVLAVVGGIGWRVYANKDAKTNVSTTTKKSMSPGEIISAVTTDVPSSNTILHARPNVGDNQQSIMYKLPGKSYVRELRSSDHYVIFSITANAAQDPDVILKSATTSLAKLSLEDDSKNSVPLSNNEAIDYASAIYKNDSTVCEASSTGFSMTVSCTELSAFEDAYKISDPIVDKFREANPSVAFDSISVTFEESISGKVSGATLVTFQTKATFSAINPTQYLLAKVGDANWEYVGSLKQTSQNSVDILPPGCSTLTNPKYERVFSSLCP